MITVPGRILQGPAVTYKAGKLANTADGQWNMARIVLTSSPTSLLNYSILYISVSNNQGVWRPGEPGQQSFDDVCKPFHKALKDYGLAVNPPQPWPPTKLPVTDQTRDTVIDDWFRDISKNPNRPKLVLVILPRKEAKLYNRIKYCGDVIYGIHTVCVVGSKFRGKINRATNLLETDPQKFANVALKFNLKLGGVNQSLENSKIGIIANNKTMVVGIDVTHPSPGSASNAPSIASMVASVDGKLGQWPAILQIQEARKEMVSDLGSLLISRLRLWQGSGKGQPQKPLPDNILIYRDGVSEGQYEIVLNNELPLLREACEKIYSKPQTKAGTPKISIIVVGKRHHTRFYPTSGEKDVTHQRSGNPKNGTIVDRGVTEPRNWDFFLQAHAAITGTARPAHYFVVHDEIFVKNANAANDLEQLTHNMCYMFGRATKAVSICPPAYYADLVCTRARCYLSRFFDGTHGSTTDGGGRDPDANLVTVHPNLKDTMFYI